MVKCPQNANGNVNVEHTEHTSDAIHIAPHKRAVIEKILLFISDVQSVQVYILSYFYLDTRYTHYTRRRHAGILFTSYGFYRVI